MKDIFSRKLIRYLLVGGSAFLTEYGSFLILYQALKVQMYIANSVSFCLGLLVSFLFNRGWTFKTEANYKLKVHHQFLAYSCLALFNLVMTNIVIGLLRGAGLDPRIGKVFAMLLVVGWNFLIFKAVIFVEHRNPKV